MPVCTMHVVRRLVVLQCVVCSECQPGFQREHRAHKECWERDIFRLPADLHGFCQSVVNGQCCQTWILTAGYLYSRDAVARGLGDFSQTRKNAVYLRK